MGEPSPKRRRTNLDFDEKKQIISYKLSHHRASQKEICDHFTKLWNKHIGRSTICDILKQKDVVLSSPASKRARHRNGANESLEAALFSWFTDIRSKNVFVSDRMLIDKAKSFGVQLNINNDFKYSMGWIQRFKQRHGLKVHTAQDKSGSADMSLVTSGE